MALSESFANPLEIAKSYFRSVLALRNFCRLPQKPDSQDFVLWPG